MSFILHCSSKRVYTIGVNTFDRTVIKITFHVLILFHKSELPHIRRTQMYDPRASTVSTRVEHRNIQQIKMILCFFLFNLLMLWIILMDWEVLNNPYARGINFTWPVTNDCFSHVVGLNLQKLGYKFLTLCLWRTLVCIFLITPLLGFGIRECWPHKISWGVLPPLQVSGRVCIELVLFLS